MRLRFKDSAADHPAPEFSYTTFEAPYEPGGIKTEISVGAGKYLDVRETSTISAGTICTATTSKTVWQPKRDTFSKPTRQSR